MEITQSRFFARFSTAVFSSFDRIQVKYGDTWAPHRGCHNWHNRTIIDLERDDVITEVDTDRISESLSFLASIVKGLLTPTNNEREMSAFGLGHKVLCKDFQYGNNFIIYCGVYLV